MHIPSRFIRNIEVIVDVRESSRERVLFVGQPVDAVEVAVIPERAWWWRGRCRSRRPFASSSGPDEEVAEQTEGFDKTKKFVVGQVIDVTSPSCAACDPTTVEDWIGFVKGRRELASKRIRNEESTKKFDVAITVSGISVLMKVSVPWLATMPPAVVSRTASEGSPSPFGSLQIATV